MLFLDQKNKRIMKEFKEPLVLQHSNSSSGPNFRVDYFQVIYNQVSLDAGTATALRKEEETSMHPNLSFFNHCKVMALHPKFRYTHLPL